VSQYAKNHRGENKIKQKQKTKSGNDVVQMGRREEGQNTEEKCGKGRGKEGTRTIAIRKEGKRSRVNGGCHEAKKTGAVGKANLKGILERVWKENG